MTGTGQTGMQGHAPTVLIERCERSKYEEVWRQPEYRAIAPGEQYLEKFCAQADLQSGDTLTDFGCGTGRAAVRLNSKHLNVTMMDFASNCLDEWVLRLTDKYPDSLKFVRHDLSQWPYPIRRAKHGYCTDCMEHIPPKQVETVLWNIVRNARFVFFAISTRPDNGLGDEPLHLTVENHAWWKAKLEALRCSILWEEEAGDVSFFYVTAFVQREDLYDAMVLNVEEEKIGEQILANLRLGLKEISPHEPQPDTEVVLLAGGPSLTDFKEEIYGKAAAGVPVVTVNGTYNWALERGIKPAATVVLDGRAFNKRFVEPPIEGCKYLLASQCHASLVAAVPAEQVWLWHSGNAPRVRESLEAWSKETEIQRQWWPVYGGSTVVLRAIVLLRMLGFTKLHIYGFDSCLREGRHHAYSQPENDAAQTIDVSVGERTFQCHPWMWSQAEEFIDLMKVLTDLEIEVYGDGLIAHIVRTAADIPHEDDGSPPLRYGFIDTYEDLSNGNLCIPPLQRGEEVPAHGQTADLRHGAAGGAL